jgi:hypothetical protein
MPGPGLHRPVQERDEPLVAPRGRTGRAPGRPGPPTAPPRPTSPWHRSPAPPPPRPGRTAAALRPRPACRPPSPPRPGPGAAGPARGRPFRWRRSPGSFQPWPLMEYGPAPGASSGARRLTPTPRGPWSSSCVPDVRPAVGIPRRGPPRAPPARTRRMYGVKMENLPVSSKSSSSRGSDHLDAQEVETRSPAPAARARCSSPEGEAQSPSSSNSRYRSLSAGRTASVARASVVVGAEKAARSRSVRMSALWTRIGPVHAGRASAAFQEPASRLQRTVRLLRDQDLSAPAVRSRYDPGSGRRGGKRSRRSGRRPSFEDPLGHPVQDRHAGDLDQRLGPRRSAAGAGCRARPPGSWHPLRPPPHAVARLVNLPCPAGGGAGRIRTS